MSSYPEAPERVSSWIGVLVGSSCFLIAPFPGFVEFVGSGVDGMVFFVGSVFFTWAAALQCLETFNADRGPGGGHQRRWIDWWSSVIQLVGTLLFNRDTFRAMQTGLEQPSYDQLVWRPDALGSACFLVSGYLAYVEVCGGLACRPRRGQRLHGPRCPLLPRRSGTPAARIRHSGLLMTRRPSNPSGRDGPQFHPH
jgi:hypothetical protein